MVGRKNGKSTLASGIGLYMLYADAENGPEVYSVATTRDQAKLSWNEAKKMINKSPSLKKKARPLVGEILTDFNDGVFRPLAADSNTLDGLNPSAAIMDEIAAWKNGQALYDVIIDGETAREQPLNIMITTAGTVREDVFDTLYERSERLINSWKGSEDDGFRDEHFLPLIYELDNRKEWTDETAWKKANPSPHRNGRGPEWASSSPAAAPKAWRTSAPSKCSKSWTSPSTTSWAPVSAPSSAACTPWAIRPTSLTLSCAPRTGTC